MLSWLITMHDEWKIVERTVKAIKLEHPWDEIHIAQSDDGSGKRIPHVTSFDVLPNLIDQYPHERLGSHAVCRNYSHLFKRVKRGNWLVALTGDTLIKDATMVNRLTQIAGKRVLCCSQAIGQKFHAADGTREGRPQYPGISDFMPQFFVVNGSWQKDTGAFVDIEVTNEWTTEQCLGDEFVKRRGNFDAFVISNDAYGYSDGISYQTKKNV